MSAANVESKRRCGELAALARLASAAGARYEGCLRQVDTYFDVPAVRLKLRETTRHTGDRVSTCAELIRYDRPDDEGARVSRYERTRIADVPGARRELEAEHGVRGTVEKRRELWILGATRIHLDSVEGVGDFVELETVAVGEPGPAELEEHDRVSSLLGIAGRAGVAGSYIDLVLEQARSGAAG